MAKLARHCVQVNGSPTAARALIEARLGVQTSTRPEGPGVWVVYFDASSDVDLDFLRPDVLPPRVARSMQVS